VFPWVFHHLDEPERVEGRAATTFVGSRITAAAKDPRFVEAVGHTLVYTLLSVACAPVRHACRRGLPPENFRCAVSCAAVIMPMMATPVAIALVWTMMFHPQLGVLNYLLSLVGIGSSSGSFTPPP